VSPRGGRGLALALVVGLALPACATPGPVRDLTEKTGANVSFVSTQLGRLAQDSRRLAEGRATNVAGLHAQTTGLKLSIEADEQILDKVHSARLTRLRELRVFAERILQSYAESAKAGTERRARVVAGQQALGAPGKQLATVAGGLAALAREDEPRARLEFLAGFVGTVVKEVEERQKDKEKSMASAESAINANAPKALKPAGGDQ